MRVSYDAPFEGGGGRPLRFRAELKGAGDGVLFAVTWASEPTAEERKAGVTDLTRSDVLLRASEGWTALDETRYPPGWARTARLALLLPPGTGAGLDEVRVEREAAGATRPSVAVRTFKTATLEPDGSVDVLAQRTVRATGVRPAARLASGAVLDRLRVDVPAEASEGALAFKGVLVGEEQEIRRPPPGRPPRRACASPCRPPAPRRSASSRRSPPPTSAPRSACWGTSCPSASRPGPGNGWRRWTGC